MTIVPATRRTEAEARLGDALGHLKRHGDGVQFDNHVEFIISAAMLLGLMRLREGITARESEKIVTSALLAMCRANERGLDEFEGRVEKMQSDTLKSPKKTLHLLACVRAKHPFLPIKGNLLTARIGAVHVRFAKDFPKRARVEPFGIGDAKVDMRASKPFIPIWATVKARSELEAADRGMAAIKAMLGCINLVLNHGVQRDHSGRRSPRNTVRLVGDQIVYRADWSRYEDFFFYESEADHPERWPVDLDADIAHHRKPLSRMLTRLNDRVFGRLLIEAMQDYHEALSHVDTALVHVRLWGLLERLTNTQADESRATIRRATFLSSATEQRRLRLRQAADARHAFVHRRVRAPFIDHLSEDLRYWAEEMLIYIFFVRRTFRDLDFFFRLLDSPQSAKEVERASSILRIARELVK